MFTRGSEIWLKKVTSLTQPLVDILPLTKSETHFTH